MKNKFLSILTMSVLAISMLSGCKTTDTNKTESNEVIATTVETVVENIEETTEVSHAHTYTKSISTEATCETDGESIFICNCGDSYTESIIATGHTFETYTSNNDATYTADGTETATCKTCEATDTRTAENSQLVYTYIDTEAIMYAQQTVNIRNLPSTDGEKLGSLSTNDEVKVTGQCSETGWYRIDYNGNTAYISNNYLAPDKVIVHTETPKQNSSGGYNFVYKSGYTWIDTPVSSYDEVCAIARALGYDLWQFHDNGDGSIWCYAIVCNGGDNKGTYNEDFKYMRDICTAHSGGYSWGNHLNTKDGFIHIPASNGFGWSIGTCVSTQ